jgi:hypothetical protein
MRAVLIAVLPAVLLAAPATAGDLACDPDTYCIDAQCEAGHDPREQVVVRSWDTGQPIFHTRYDDMTVVRRDGVDRLTWTGRNSQGQVEQLTYRPSDGAYTHVITLEDGSAAHSLTARGSCQVRG